MISNKDLNEARKQILQEMSELSRNQCDQTQKFLTSVGEQTAKTINDVALKVYGENTLL